MWGGGTETVTNTQTSAPTNPAVDATTTKLLNRLQGQVDQGTAVFNENLYPGVGQTTKNSWAAMTNAAGNPTFGNAINQTMGEFGQIAAGNRMGAGDASWNAARDDALTDVNAMFTTNGRFGSGSHVGAAAEGLASVDLARLQQGEARQMQAAAALPGMFQASLMPAGVLGSVGAAQDADALAMVQGRNDLFRRQNDTGWDTLGRATSIAAGNAGNSGMATTSSQTSPTAPWWQQVLGAGAIGSGIYKNIWGA